MNSKQQFEPIQKNVRKVFEKDYVMKRRFFNKLRRNIATIKSRFVEKERKKRLEEGRKRLEERKQGKA